MSSPTHNEVSVERWTVGPHGVVCHRIIDRATGAWALVDVGDDRHCIFEQLSTLSGLQWILLTHGHLDHAGGIAQLPASCRAKVAAPAGDQALLADLGAQAAWWGEPPRKLPLLPIHRWLCDGDSVTLGRTTVSFLSTPGHTPGHGCYRTADHVLVGDLLDAETIGRTDLPGGNRDMLRASLRKLARLPGHLCIHPGFGASTTLAEALQANPRLAFLRRETSSTS